MSPTKTRRIFVRWKYAQLTGRLAEGVSVGEYYASLMRQGKVMGENGAHNADPYATDDLTSYPLRVPDPSCKLGSQVMACAVARALAARPGNTEPLAVLSDEEKAAFQREEAASLGARLRTEPSEAGFFANPAVKYAVAHVDTNKDGDPNHFILIYRGPDGKWYTMDNEPSRRPTAEVNWADVYSVKFDRDPNTECSEPSNPRC